MTATLETQTEIDPKVYQRRWIILLVLCLSVFMVVVDNLIINVALPTLSRELGATTSGLQWIVDSYALVFACLLLAFGGLGDRFGRKGAIQIGMVAFVLFSVWASFATSTASLIIARGAMGIGAAAIFPATLAIVIDVFRDPIERAKAIGIWSAVAGMAVAFAPIKVFEQEPPCNWAKSNWYLVGGRGNGCGVWPNYRRVLARTLLLGLSIPDQSSDWSDRVSAWRNTHSNIEGSKSSPT